MRAKKSWVENVCYETLYVSTTTWRDSLFTNMEPSREICFRGCSVSFASISRNSMLLLLLCNFVLRRTFLDQKSGCFIFESSKMIPMSPSKTQPIENRERDGLNNYSLLSGFVIIGLLPLNVGTLRFSTMIRSNGVSFWMEFVVKGFVIQCAFDVTDFSGPPKRSVISKVCYIERLL